MKWTTENNIHDITAIQNAEKQHPNTETVNILYIKKKRKKKRYIKKKRNKEKRKQKKENTENKRKKETKQDLKLNLNAETWFKYWCHIN